MKRIVPCLSISLLVVSGCEFETEPETGSVEQASSANYSPGIGSATADQLWWSLFGNRIGLGAPGAVAAAMTADGEYWLGGVGSARIGETPMDYWTSTAFGSITKTFTAALVLKLRDSPAFAISLDDTLSQYGCASVHGCGFGFENAEAITLRHLLSHTGGIPRFFDQPWVQQALADCTASNPTLGAWTPDDVIAQTNDLPPLHPPGQPGTLELTEIYGNVNFMLLAQIVAEVTGTSFENAMSQHIIGPAGLSGYLTLEHLPQPWYATGYNVSGADVTGCLPFAEGASGLVGYSGALLSFWWQLFNGQVIASSSVDEMTAAVAVSPSDPNTAYGLGLGIVYSGPGGHPLYTHSGGTSGFHATAAYLPDIDLTLVKNINRWHGDPDNWILTDMISILEP